MSGPAVVPCQRCQGSGAASSDRENPEVVCGTCMGLGSVVVYLSADGKPVQCARCGGKGGTESHQTCPSCLGCGWVGRIKEFR